MSGSCKPAGGGRDGAHKRLREGPNEGYYFVKMASWVPYSLRIVWRDRLRYLPAVLAVAFSAVLIAMQCGLVMGLLLCTAVPIDHAAADIWVLAADAVSLQQAYPIPDAWQLRLAEQPEVVRTESYLLGEGLWHKPNQGGSEFCIIIGMRLDDDSLGVVDAISPELRARLTEPGTVVVDAWELANLGLDRPALEQGLFAITEVNGRRVKVVGVLHGFHGHNFTYIFCSQQTACELLPRFSADRGLTMGVLARCRDSADVPVVIERLRRLYPDMGVYSRAELSYKVRTYWLFRSTGGTVLVCTIVLALLVGLVVTSQILYAAGLASLREYAVLDALGIPRARLVRLVIAKSFWIGIGGIVLALPVVYLLSWAALLIPARVILPQDVLLFTGAVTLANALLSGAYALRPLRNLEPAFLLR
jgi:putative ABC transport system permease protein